MLGLSFLFNHVLKRIWIDTHLFNLAAQADLRGLKIEVLNCIYIYLYIRCKR